MPQELRATRDLRNLTAEALAHDELNPHRAVALRTTIEVIVALGEKIDTLESTSLATLRPDPAWQYLKTIWGVGSILATTKYLESGPSAQFASPGDYASYCRCVRSQRISNGKSKGKGNGECGNRYLASARMEAANFAIRSYPAAKRFYERKAAANNTILARKTLARELARAGWHVMKTAAPLNPSRLFS